MLISVEGASGVSRIASEHQTMDLTFPAVIADLYESRPAISPDSPVNMRSSKSEFSLKIARTVVASVAIPVGTMIPKRPS